MHKLLALVSIGTLAATSATAVIAQPGSERSAASNPVERRSYPIGAFDSVSAAGPHTVIVTVGSAPSVRATGPKQTLDLFEVVVEDHVLKIQPKHDRRWDHGWPKIAPATYYVSVPRLTATSFAGSGEMKVDRVAGGKFKATLAGSGDLAIASLSVDEADFSVAGSGSLTARGKARSSRVSIAGSGDVLTRGVSSETASVSVAGSGDAALTVSHDAHISIVGSGDVAIAGSAHCTVSRLGSGHATCSG